MQNAPTGSNPIGSPTLPHARPQQATRPEQLIRKLGENRYVVNTNLDMGERATFLAYQDEHHPHGWFDSREKALDAAQKVFNTLASPEETRTPQTTTSNAIPTSNEDVFIRRRSPHYDSRYPVATEPEQLLFRLGGDTYMVNKLLNVVDHRAPISAHTNEQHQNGRFTRNEALLQAKALLDRHYNRDTEENK